ncbi:MAG: N-acetylmuramic acid 6-phosphate etherase [Fimbriimonadaceae bacterium]|nr:N-acetylmuramic acid 6-phosphate etherase [Fimbriimonadaceae bacterium]
MSTESRHPRSHGLDKMSAREIVRLMNEEEFVVMRALQQAEEGIAEAIDRAARAFREGGRVIYVGSGTSGRIAVMDAAEMPPTFGIASDRFVALVSGGQVAEGKAVEDAEDDEHAAITAMNDLMLGRHDVVIGLAASGRTPFVIAAVKHARQKGVWTCGIANNKRTPLLHSVDLPILLDTGPEILTGSTRLKAGTAQKLVLNRISTGAMVLNGKVIENLMVDVKAKNQKLKERCARIVQELTTGTLDEAWSVLEQNEWNVRAAVAILRDRHAVKV